MRGGAPPESEITAIRAAVVEQHRRLRRVAKQVPDSADWRMFYAGAMCMMTHKMNTQLTRFLVTVSDE